MGTGAPTEVYSFDVFDTCVTRRFAKPTDLFHQLGLQLAAEFNVGGDPEDFAGRFAKARILGERKANSLVRPHECATLDEIYAHIELDEHLRLHRSEVIAAEIQLERESIFAVPHIAERIRTLRERGARIIFISDMYLPAAVLGPILEDLGIMRAPDVLYVSSDVRLTKRTGNLFRHVIDAQDCRAEQVWHVGDNVGADIRTARSLGVKAEHFEAASLTPYEARIAGDRILSSSTSASFIAALSRESRLRGSPADTGHMIDHLAHSTIAPFLVAYVSWVISRAKAQGVKRLYFVARDGEVLYRIACELLRDDQDVEPRYLYGSRKAWLLPSITAQSRTWLNQLVTAGALTSASEVLARADIDAGVTGRIAEILHMTRSELERTLTADQGRAFLERLLGNPEAKQLVMDKAARAREILLEYLSQEGLFDTSPWALVDVGWSLNCQAALKAIVAARDQHVAEQVRGYYLAFSHSKRTADEAGASEAFLDDPNFIFSRRAAVVEHCLIPATHATTVSYAPVSGIAQPVLGEELRSADELHYAKRIQDIARTTARLVASNPAYRKALSRATTDIVQNVSRLLTNPSRQEAAFFGSTSAVLDVRHERHLVQPLCAPLTLRQLFGFLLATMGNKKVSTANLILWPEASCVLSPIRVRWPLLALLRLKGFRQGLSSARSRAGKDRGVGAVR